MEWWQKLRRAWTFIGASLKTRKFANSKCVKNKNEGIGKGLLSLRDDVETCEYQDVHVMWDILNQLHAAEQSTSQVANTSKTMKKGHSWKAFFCSFSLLN